jgi:hypothetical protein
MTVRLVDLPPTTSSLVTPLWTVKKDSHRIEAELVEHGAAGWEIRLLRGHEWQSGGCFRNRVQAVTRAVDTRRELLTRGWSPAVGLSTLRVRPSA